MTTNSEACKFAELFLSRASSYTQNYAVSKNISLGSELVKLHINEDENLRWTKNSTNKLNFGMLK